MTTSNAEMIARLLPTFLSELASRTTDMERQFQSLAVGPAGGRCDREVYRLFREAHSLKGAARAVQDSTVESACERIERALLEPRRGLDRPGDECIAVLREAICELRWSEARHALLDDGPLGHSDDS